MLLLLPIHTIWSSYCRLKTTHIYKFFASLPSFYFFYIYVLDFQHTICHFTTFFSERKHISCFCSFQNMAVWTLILHCCNCTFKYIVGTQKTKNINDELVCVMIRSSFDLWNYHLFMWKSVILIGSTNLHSFTHFWDNVSCSPYGFTDSQSRRLFLVKGTIRGIRKSMWWAAQADWTILLILFRMVKN